MIFIDESDSLSHYGVLGMHWGVRKDGKPQGFQYGNGSKTLFISGSSKTQDKESEYYRKRLPKQITKEIDSAISKHDKIIVGDAPGIDRQVQNYLNNKKYDNVVVYGPGKEVRYLANNKWQTNLVDAPEYEVNSKEWLAKKDEEMAKAADYGIAIVLENGGASATRNNVDRLIQQNKDVKVYELTSSDDDHWV